MSRRQLRKVLLREREIFVCRDRNILKKCEVRMRHEPAWLIPEPAFIAARNDPGK